MQASSASVPPTGATTTVLIVEDHVELRAMNAAYLERHGCRVLQAGDGVSALAAARQHHPDVVLLDHSIPALSGLEVAAEMKRDPATATIPVLLLTAHAYGAIGRRARAAGCAAFLSKPCAPSRVLREVLRFAPAAPSA